jgi:hypothetical protein
MSRYELLRFQQELTAALAGGPRRANVGGIDPERLALMARLAHTKRMGKVARVMPATLSLVAAQAPAWMDAFRVEWPLRDARSYANGVEFFRFAVRRFVGSPRFPSFAKDLARCEIALAAVAQRVGPVVSPRRAWSGTAMLIRRSPAAVFRVVEHDISELLRSRHAEGAIVERRRVHLALVPPARDPEDDASGQPRVFELDKEVFRWARARRSLQVVDRKTVSKQAWALLARLATIGVLEARVPSAGALPPNGQS